jgi:hypothetical protein
VGTGNWVSAIPIPIPIHIPISISILPRPFLLRFLLFNFRTRRRRRTRPRPMGTSTTAYHRPTESSKCHWRHSQPFVPHVIGYTSSTCFVAPGSTRRRGRNRGRSVSRVQIRFRLTAEGRNKTRRAEARLVGGNAWSDRRYQVVTGFPVAGSILSAAGLIVCASPLRI